MKQIYIFAFAILLSANVLAATASTSGNNINKTVSNVNQGGFGEFAGNLVYKLNPGESHVEYWTLINKFNYPISFQVTPPAYASVNDTSPIIHFSALNGTIPAGSNFTITVNVTAPGEGAYFLSTGPKTYSGYALAASKPAASSAGGASNSAWDCKDHPGNYNSIRYNPTDHYRYNSNSSSSIGDIFAAQAHPK